APESRYRAAWRARCPAARRADRGSRSGSAPAALGAARGAARGGGRPPLRHPAARGGRGPRGQGRRAPRGSGCICGAGRRVRRGRPRRMTRVALLLRKDALILRRSPLLLGLLLAYPLMIALLVGLVAGYANAKPRVALVDEAGLPRFVTVGGHRFDVDRTIKRVGKDVDLVKLGPDEAQRELRSGRVVAVLTVPPGFIATLQGMVSSPKLEVRSEERRVGKECRCGRATEQEM